ncbi:hypothetical protein PLICRDRAFT_694917 [Plicaturopsis crispa FD-325 SS-3]|nr:hypothetical protein PLICRDRAFT_694917 [Plicaturopsis crispa FD-325 SS-3]
MAGAASEEAPTREILITVVTPYFFGIIFDWALLGCLSVQIYMYSISNSSDQWGLKTFVYSVYAIDFVQTVIATYSSWLALVWDQGSFANPLDIIRAVCIVQMLAGVVSCMVECFFARRIWILKNTPIMRTIVVGILMLAIIQCSSAIAYGAQGVTNKLFSKSEKIPAPTMWLGGSFLCDILIAGTMLHLLLEARSQTSFKATETLLTRLIVLTVQTGFITAIVAGMQLTAYYLGLVVLNEYSYLFSFMLGPLYSNVLLATVNARAVVVRVVDNEVNTVAIRTSEGFAFRLELTGISRTGDPGGVIRAEDRTSFTNQRDSEPTSKEHVDADLSV